MSNSNVIQSSLENRLLIAWTDVFAISNLKISQSDFFDLGGDSLKFKRLQRLIRHLVDFELSPGQLFETPTIESLAKFISASNGHRENLEFNHIIEMNKQNRKSAIYICHGMHGDTFEWRFIADALCTNRYVYGLQDPTHRNIDTKNLHRTMESLGDYHAEELRKHSEDDFCLAGYSVGAWVAYSTAISLERLGARKIKLYLFEPSRLPCSQSFILSESKLLKMGFKFKGRSASLIRCDAKNKIFMPDSDMKTFQLKDPTIDPTYLKTLYYQPSSSNAKINIAIRSEVANNLGNYYIASISNSTPNIILIKGMKAHLEFRLKEHATVIAQSIEYAFSR